MKVKEADRGNCEIVRFHGKEADVKTQDGTGEHFGGTLYSSWLESELFNAEDAEARRIAEMGRGAQAAGLLCLAARQRPVKRAVVENRFPSPIDRRASRSF